MNSATKLGKKVARSLVLAALVLHVPAQHSPAPDGRPRIAVLGASLSKGMDLGSQVAQRGMGALLNGVPEHRKSTIGLADLFAKVAAGGASDHSDLYLFADPLSRVRGQVQAAVQAQPDLILGVDLLFWFGYWPNVSVLAKGDPGSDLLQTYGAPDAEIEKALRSVEKQAAGFAIVDELLAKTKATLVLGDYPDMFGANPLMLNPKHIPKRRTLDELNRRLSDFARTRPRVLVYPLADYVARAKRGELPLPDGNGQMVTAEYAMQADNLHPTRLGTALVMHELFQFVVGKLAPDALALLGPPPTFATLVEKAGATAELAAARAETKTSAPGPGARK